MEDGSGRERIQHLSCGTMCPVGARMIQGEGGWLAAADIVCHCLLIETGEGLVLVDTGFGLDDARNPHQLGRAFGALMRPRPTESETALERLRALGHDPSDVRDIVITHLDLDHAGGLPDFPGARVHVIAREHEAAMNPGWRDRARYVAAHWSHKPDWVLHEAEGDEWLGFTSVRVLPGTDPEVLLIPLHGHTLGHTGVAVRRGNGWLLHCGDAYFHHGEVETPSHCPPALRLFQSLNNADGAARRENQERLRELAQRQGNEVELICSHDPAYLR